LFSDVRIGDQENVYGWLRDNFRDEPYAKYLLGGVPPPQVSVSRGLTVSLKQMAILQDDYNITAHFHRVSAGSLYFLRRGSMHFVLNEGLSGSMAGDAVYGWETHPLSAQFPATSYPLPPGHV
jgi:hypothetical protein